MSRRLKNIRKDFKSKKCFKEVKCAHPRCNIMVSVIAVTGKTLCPDCFSEQMNIYRRGEKYVIDSARTRT
jgi:hypothetical protein